MKKILVIGLAAALAFSVISPAMAAGWSKKQGIAKLRLTANGDTLVTGNSPTWKNPDGCKKAKAALLPGDAQYFPEMYATLLVAQTRGTPVKLYFSGCLKMGSKTFPRIRIVEKY